MDKLTAKIGDSNPNPNPDRDSNPNPDPNLNLNPNSNPNPDANSNPNPDPNPNPYLNLNLKCESNPIHNSDTSSRTLTPILTLILALDSDAKKRAMVFEPAYKEIMMMLYQVFDVN
jgi:hypothetical protein